MGAESLVWRKVLTALVLAIALLTLFAGQVRAELRYVTWVGGASKLLEDEVVAMFRERYPEIPVDFETLPGGQGNLVQHILVQTAAGVRIDIALTHTHWLQTLVDNGLLVDLRPYIERDGVDLSLFPAAVMESYRGPRGEIFAFPQQWTTIVLAFNRDVLERFGVAEPADDWDIFDLEEMGRRLTTSRDGEQIDTWGLRVQSLHEYVWRLWGVPFTNEDRTESGWDDPRAVEAWSWYQELHREPLLNNDYGAWVNGRTALNLSWPHQLIENGRAMEDAWDIVLHPKGAHGERVARAAGAQWVILKTSPDPDAAWEFIKFMISQEAQKAYLERGRGGVQIPAMIEYWVESFDLSASGITNPRTLLNRQAIVDGYGYASLDRQPGNWAELLSQVINPMAARLRNQEVPAAAAVPEAARQINALLRELRR